LGCYDGLLDLYHLGCSPIQSMSQPMLAKPIWRFALGKVEACTGAINLMIDGFAIGLAGNAAFPVYDFH